MQVALIRHAKVNMKWKFWLTSAEYDKGCAAYDAAPVLPVTVKLPQTDYRKIYVSALPRTTATARQVVGDTELHSTALINEVPDRAGFDTGLKLPMFLWSAISRVQWFTNMRRQPETRTETKHRATQFAQYLLEQNENCAVLYVLTLKHSRSGNSTTVSEEDSMISMPPSASNVLSAISVPISTSKPVSTSFSSW